MSERLLQHSMGGVRGQGVRREGGGEGGTHTS